MGSTTSSFRISDDLRVPLERAERRLKKRKNWIVNQALREYLRKTDRQTFLDEARRQSILASSVVTPEEEFWSQLVDTRGWE